MQLSCNTVKKPKFSLQAPSAVARNGQRGVALVVVLLFLVAVTGISVWTARQSMLAESHGKKPDRPRGRQASGRSRSARCRARHRQRRVRHEMTNASCARNSSPTDDGGINIAEFSTTCTRGLCLKDDTSYKDTNWKTASTSNATVAEP